MLSPVFRAGPLRPYRRNNYVRNAVYAAGPIAAYAAGRIRHAMANSGMSIPSRPTQAAKAVNKAIKANRKMRNELVRINKKEKPVAKLAKQVKNLQIMSKADQGELIYRERDASLLKCNVNEQNASDILGWSTSTLESVLANCKFFNPAVPGTLTTADLSTGTYQRDIHFASAFSRLRVRNNYQVPVRVDIYCCLVKDDTNITPRNAWNNGLADMSSLTYTSPMTFPTDSHQFTDIYKIHMTSKKLLAPGQEHSVKYTAPKFIYDPSLVDSHGLTYLKQFKCHGYIVKVEGVLGHDTSAGEAGNLQAGVDIEIYRSFKVHYSAGAQIRILATSDGFDAFTNGGVITSKPVADNIGYSVA